MRIPEAPEPRGLAGLPGRTGRARPTVQPHVADAHAAAAVRSNDAAIADRIGSHWRPDDERSVGARAEFGPEPVEQVRRTYVAKFNPALAHPAVGRFDRSDPHTTDELWRLPSESWISDDPRNARSAPAFSRIAPGDLVFVQRGEPRWENRTYLDPSPLDGRPHLIGLWFVTAVHRYHHPNVPRRVVTNVWHAPIVRFSDPVDLRTVRRDPTVDAVSAFGDRTQAMLLELSPYDAAVLADVCSLPSSVLIEPDPAKAAARLRDTRAGMRSEDRKYRRDARYRHGIRRDVEQAAVARTEADMVAAGWSVVRMEHVPLWGADLDCARDGKHRAIEVKGRLRDDWRNAQLEQSQYDRARTAARTGEEDWWLFIHPLAASLNPPPYVQLPASWVAENWPAENVNRRRHP